MTLYVFSNDKSFKQKVFDNTQSGSAIANDVMTHMAVDHLPFGGIGESGSEWTIVYTSLFYSLKRIHFISGHNDRQIFV